MAIRAADLNNPGLDEDGQLVQAIARSKILPQGLCVLNSSGQALEWVATFDNEASVTAFFNRALVRYKRNPDGRMDNVTERFMKFPDGRLPDFQEEAVSSSFLSRISQSRNSNISTKEFVVKLTGRALNADGSAVADTLRQEHYVEDTFVIDQDLAQELMRQASSNYRRFVLPKRLSYLLVKHAYLGQLDLQPLAGAMPSAEHDLKKCNLWAERIADNKLRIEGDTEISVSSPGRPGDGASFANEIKLHWTGYADFDKTHLGKLLLWSHGFENAHWSSGPSFPASKDFALSSLPAGHRFEMASNVAFGFEGKMETGELAVTARKTPLTGGTTSADDSANPNLAQRIQQKINTLQTSLPEWIAEGGDQKVISTSMEKVGSLMQNGRPDEAEKLLDVVLGLTKSHDKQPPNLSSNAPELNLPNRIQQKLSKVQSQMPNYLKAGGNQIEVSAKMNQIGNLMQTSRPDEAEHMLDSVLAVISKPRN